MLETRIRRTNIETCVMRAFSGPAVRPQRWTKAAIWLMMISLPIPTATGQDRGNTSFRAYPTYSTPVAQAAAQLQQRLQKEGIDADVVPDPQGKRLLVDGPMESQRIAAEYVRTLTAPAASGTAELRSYPVSGDNLSDSVSSLRRRYAGQDNVRIAMDQRNQQILVHAPSKVHAEIARVLSSASINATSETTPDRRLESEAEASLSWAGDEVRRADAKLRHITWQQLIAVIEGMTPNKLTLTQSDDSRVLELSLPAKRGQTKLLLNPATGQYRLEGSDLLVRNWAHAIGTIDQPSRARDETTQVIPISDEDAVTTITRAVDVLQNARQNALSARVRWGGDLVGIASRASTDGFVELQEADTAIAQNEAQDEPAPPRPQDENGGEDNVELQLPGGDVGVDGAMIGPVQIEFVEGLDSIIIRGRRPDVERVMKIIDDIERLSIITEPTIELIPLQHVNSLSMAELVTQLNTQALAARRGTVSITPLIKPNALLLIGREEGVKATVELIERLDQPVSPASQFKIFPLTHMSATDAQQTIETFFAERGGLGPLIQVQADFRTNSLIVYASPRDMQEVGHLIEKIDINEGKAVDEVRVFKLKNALADELAPVLQATLRGDDTQGRTGLGQQGGGQFQPQAGGLGQNQANQRGQFTAPRSSMLTLTIDEQGNRVLKSGLLTNVRVAADVRANSLVVTAPPESMDLIAALVEQLDELPTSEASIKVFTIINGDAPSLAETLAELFGEANQQDGPALQSATGAGESSLVPLRFSVDLRTNSIIATGSEADLGVVEAILLRLDQDDISQRRSRVYRLLNAPALDVATAINEFLRSERDIQLVAPESVSPFEQIEREVIVVPEVVSNSLIISSTPRYFEQIEEIVKELDERPPMVLIQVLIAEVDLGNVEEFGVELGIQDSLLFDRSVVFSDATTSGRLVPGFNFNNQTLGNSNSDASLATREKVAGQALTNFALGRSSSDVNYGGLVLSASSESINLLIRALRESRRLDILSRPQVMTLNNQPAFVLVGQRVPYIQNVQVLTSGQTITPTEFENVGIVLGVTPRISPDDTVVMEIDAEKSELAIGEGIALSVDADGNIIRQPPIDTTTLQTTVSARSGQTVILGGLITKSKQSISRRVPYLADVPLLGDLFRYDSVKEERTELLIIMTPHIVRKTEDSDVLNQIESERMSWCLADVIEINGDSNLSSGGINRGGVGYTELIYPDLDPTGVDASVPEEVPNPNARPMNPPATGPNSGAPTPAPLRDQASTPPARRLTSRVGSWLQPNRRPNKAAELFAPDDVVDTEFSPLDAPENQPPREALDASDALNPPTPDPIPAVSPVQYVAPRAADDSKWKKLRKKLSLNRRGNS